MLKRANGGASVRYFCDIHLSTDDLPEQMGFLLTHDWPQAFLTFHEVLDILEKYRQKIVEQKLLPHEWQTDLYGAALFF